MSEISSSPEKKRGRKLSFDRDVALHNAMMTFWKYGYETTSVSDLLAAMNISAPSLYTAFGDKKSLFLEVVEKYVTSYEDAFDAALNGAGTAREGVERLLNLAVAEHFRRGAPKGCLLVTAALNGSDASSDIQQHLVKRRNNHRKLIKARLQKGVKEGDLAPSVDIKDLSYFYTTLLQGLSIQARSGTPRRTLQMVADQGMLAWPEDSRITS